MENSPLVSVIMPFYNAVNYLNEALDSIINQTYPNIEIILVDDASTDNSLQIAAGYNESARRITILKNERNLGLAASLNKAIRSASGDFLARMDADDIAHPERIEKQVLEFINKPELDVLGGSLQYFGVSSYKNEFPEHHEECKAQLCFNVCFGHPAVMFRKEVFNDPDNYYKEELRQFSEEYHLWCRLIKKFRFGNLPDVLIYYRTFPDKANTELIRRENSDEIRKEYLLTLFKGYDIGYISLHNKIANLEKLMLKDLDKVDNYFVYLMDCHTELDRIVLKRELSKRYFEICYFNSYLGPRVFGKFIKKKYWRNFTPSVIVIIKFVVRTILHKK